MNEKIILGYHLSCHDGLASASATYSDDQEEIQVDSVFGFDYPHRDKFVEHITQPEYHGQVLVVVDISFTNEQLAKLLPVMAAVYIVDHHADFEKQIASEEFKDLQDQYDNLSFCCHGNNLGSGVMHVIQSMLEVGLSPKYSEDRMNAYEWVSDRDTHTHRFPQTRAYHITQYQQLLRIEASMTKKVPGTSFVQAADPKEFLTALKNHFDRKLDAEKMSSQGLLLVAEQRCMLYNHLANFGCFLESEVMPNFHIVMAPSIRNLDTEMGDVGNSDHNCDVTVMVRFNPLEERVDYSLRSNKYCVNLFAAYMKNRYPGLFFGGGHDGAAGMYYCGSSTDEAIKTFKKELIDFVWTRQSKK